ncbi:nucleotidyltransferase family protein [Chitinimonas viridis]|uniref:Nucleotidyltransferase family protein n=1 Tax=Chitinimonas viridis TaxID=664880 RepID=A0ABT8B525_9NEIS|nr:nucleotidyltransferase family protein [Chitinimonas viridis]MDN3577359.1 nucleotidyltransferase family protein [Chitinimonas viridis]
MLPERGQLAGLLLAAGRSSRFDPTGRQSKLLQRLPDGRLVAVAAAQTLLAAVPRVVALVPDNALPTTVQLIQALQQAGCHIVPCPTAQSGMGHTLAAGVAATQNAAGWLVMLADMPAVAASTAQAVAGALQQGAAVAAPVYAGRRGHPVGFAAVCRDDLLLLSGDQGAKVVVERFTVKQIPIDDPGVLIDIDRPSDIA